MPFRSSNLVAELNHGALKNFVFSVAKLFFSYGLNNSLVIPFRHGATSVLFPGRPEPGAVFATIAQERPTVFYGVPSAYAAMLATDGEHDVSSVRLFVSAGEALPATHPAAGRMRNRSVSFTSHWL